MRFGSIIALVLGIALGFGSGLFTARQVSGQQDAARQDLLKQLIAAKAEIESGLSVSDFRKSEKEVRAALDLASNGLTNRQKPAAADALHAISQTVAAWDETLTMCHNGGNGYVGLIEHNDASAQGAWNPRCDNKALEAIYRDMGVLPELEKFTEKPYFTLPPKRTTLLQPLLRVSLDRIRTAIDLLS